MANLSMDVAAILHCPIFGLQKKMLKIIHFRKKRDSSNDLLINNTIVIVYEVYLYELLKSRNSTLNLRNTLFKK